MIWPTLTIYLSIGNVVAMALAFRGRVRYAAILTILLQIAWVPWDIHGHYYSFFGITAASLGVAGHALWKETRVDKDKNQALYYLNILQSQEAIGAGALAVINAFIDADPSAAAAALIRAVENDAGGA